MSQTRSSDAARFDALEMRLAHQDRMVSELNDVITAQWRKIDALERAMARLKDEVQNLNVGREGPEPPPPHY